MRCPVIFMLNRQIERHLSGHRLLILSTPLYLNNSGYRLYTWAFGVDRHRQKGTTSPFWKFQTSRKIHQHISHSTSILWQSPRLFKNVLNRHPLGFVNSFRKWEKLSDAHWHFHVRPELSIWISHGCRRYWRTTWRCQEHWIISQKKSQKVYVHHTSYSTNNSPIPQKWVWVFSQS